MMDQRVDLPPRQQITDLKQAAEHIRTARRILVMGCSGGGKSTLSLKIAKRFGLSYISLDRDVFWLPGWVVRDRVEQRNIIASRILEERWIMDGTNPILPGHSAAALRFRHLGPHAAASLHLGRNQPVGEMDRPHSPRNGAGLYREGRFGIPPLHLDLRGEICAAPRRRHRRTWP